MQDRWEDPRDPELEPAPFRPQRLLEIARSRRRSISITVVLTLIAAALWSLGQQEVYEATARVGLEPTPAVMELGRDFMPAESRRGGFSEQMRALATSDAVLGRMVSRIPPSSVVEETGLIDRIRDWSGLPAAQHELTEEQRRQQQIEGIRRSVGLEVAGGGTLLLVSAVARDPRVAALLANATADALVGFREDQRKVASQRALNWLNQEAYQLRDRITRLERALADEASSSRSEEGPGGGTPDPADLEARMAALAAELQANRVDTYAMEQRLAELAPRIPGTLPGRSLSGELGILHDQYTAARAELEAAQLRYTHTHPEVQRLARVVAGLTNRFGSSDGGQGADFGLDDLVEYRRLESERARLKARASALERAIQVAADSAPEVPAPGESSESAQLERELDLARPMLETLLQRRDETAITAGTKHPSAQVLDRAVPPLAPIAPSRRKQLLLSVGLALSLGMGIALLQEVLDQRLREPEEVAAALGVPLLATIPRVKIRRAATAEGWIGSLDDPLAGEGYRNLRAALTLSRQTSKLSSLVVTSAIAGEGKTEVASSLSKSLADMGRRVLLIDADLRRGRVHEAVSVKQTPGLVDFLQGKAGLQELIQSPAAWQFHVLSCGDPPPNPSELLSSTQVAALLEEARATYDFVVIDAPVLLSISDALLLAAIADGTLIVNKNGSVARSALDRMRSDLERVGAHPVGFVLTQVERANRLLYPAYLASPYLTEPRGTQDEQRRRRTPKESR